MTPLYTKKSTLKKRGQHCPLFFSSFFSRPETIQLTGRTLRVDMTKKCISFQWTHKSFYICEGFFLLKKKGEESNHGQSCSSSICTVHRRTP